MIYFLNDLTNNQQIYFVPDADTQQKGQALNIENAVWTIGTLEDANALLPSITQSYLELRKDDFSVCSTTFNEDGTLTWKVCDLNQEQPNTDKIYQIFNPLTALYTEVIGLSSAYNQLELTQQEFLVWSGVTSVGAIEELPKRPNKPTEGTQTL